MRDSWVARESGLLVPTDGHREHPPARASRTQSRAAVAAVVVGLLAAILSTVGLFFQAAANDRQAQALEDQLAVNKITRLNEDAKYASRVGWYVSRDGRFITLSNRSLVPISDIALTAFLGSERVPLLNFYPTLPPCTEYKIPVSPQFYIPQASPLQSPSSSKYDRLVFVDVRNRWMMDSAGPPIAAGATDYVLGLVNSRPRRIWAPELSSIEDRPASDCGSG